MSDEATPLSPGHMNPVSATEMKAAFSGASIHADRFFITVRGGSVRIAFAEREPGTETDHFRTSVMLIPEDAISLQKVLQEMLKPFEAAIANATGNTIS